MYLALPLSIFFGQPRFGLPQYLCQLNPLLLLLWHGCCDIHIRLTRKLHTFIDNVASEHMNTFSCLTFAYTNKLDIWTKSGLEYPHLCRKYSLLCSNTMYITIPNLN